MVFNSFLALQSAKTSIFVELVQWTTFKILFFLLKLFLSIRFMYLCKRVIPLFSYDVSELQEHINKLHEYNEIKDVAQMVIGRLGEDYLNYLLLEL